MIDLSKKLKCGSNVFDFLASRLPSKDLIFFDVGARNGSLYSQKTFQNILLYMVLNPIKMSSKATQFKRMHLNMVL